MGRANNQGNKTNAKKITSAEHAAEALKLRLRGYSFQRIRDELGHWATSHGCRQAVVKAIADITREPAQELVEVELARLDEMFTVAFDKAVKKGDFYSIESCLKIMDRRSKLLGLDKAAQAESTLGNQLQAARERLLGKMNALIAATETPVT